MGKLVGSNPNVRVDSSFNMGALMVATPNNGGTSTSFTLTNGTLKWVFTGVGFSGYTEGVPTQGTVTGITYSNGASVVSKLTGISANITTLILDLGNGDYEGVMSQLYAGNDTLTGSARGEALGGYAGNDVITGGGGNDFLYGGSGAAGPNGIDKLNGGDGNDQLSLSRGTADGGAGEDMLVLIRTGNTNDTLDMGKAGTKAGVTFGDGTVIKNVEHVAFYGGNGNDTLTITNVGHGSQCLFDGGAGTDTLIAKLSGVTTRLFLRLPGPNSSNVFANYDIRSIERAEITAGSGNDDLTGGSLSDILNGGAGKDDLFGAFGNDTLNGGDGNDILDGSFGRDTVNGGGGDDRITGVALDRLNGGAGIDTLILDLASYSGNVTLTAAALQSGATLSDGTTIAGFERLGNVTTGAGDDFVEFVSPQFNPNFNGGAGDDTLKLDVSSTTQQVNCSLNSGSGSVAGFVGLNSVETLILLSGSGNDFITASGGDDFLSGGSGIDSLQGRSGDDTLIGGIGADRLLGGDGTDTADYSGSNRGVTIDLGWETGARGHAQGDELESIEIVIGSAFDDVLLGDSFANTLLGGVGADELSGGEGADTLTGGAGADAFIFDGALGASNVDTITDFVVADDTVHLAAFRFTALSAGALDANAFHIGAAADGADQRIIYDDATGALYFDADGDGAGAQVQFATLSVGLTLTEADFLVI